ncbi:MAG: RidA family protein [Pseudomonadota bacterium]
MKQMDTPENSIVRSAKRLPEGARQHSTAGPYSPVLVVEAARLVVISGQVAVDTEGTVVSKSFKEQARYTLENCQRQLYTADCSFADVFKVNVMLTDLNDWPQFNEVYAELVPEPRPVRTAIGAHLLPGFLVEVEMWAAKSK